jgi:peptide/nickel transport system substrate-binding protein
MVVPALPVVNGTAEPGRLARIIVLGFALAGLTLMAACTRYTVTVPGGRHPWTQPGTLRMATSLGPNTLNPFLSTQQVEALIQAFALDPLVAVDDKGRDVPILAAVVPTLENGGISRDGLTITYHLRKDVRWQDGAPFTSHDVAFSYRAIMNPATTVATRHGYDEIARVETPDRHTAVFRLKRPFAPAVHTFFAHSDAPYYILPAHLLERYHDLNRIPFNSKPVGTGPFKVERWLRGDRIEYVANDDYFLGKPKLRRIVVHLVPDENTISSQMRAHEIDWFSAATPRMFPQLRSIAGVDVRLVPMYANDGIMFNTRRAPFDDPNVRRAIGLVIDKPLLVREATYGTTVPATEDLPSFMWAFDPKAGTTARDLPRANALLDAAGWKRGSDGVRVKDGRRFSMGLAYRTDSITDRNRGVLIASMLKDAGIETELKGYTTALLYGPPGAGILADGKFDASLQTWYAGSDPDNSTQLTCDQVAPKGFNWSRYCNPAMDAAQHAALSHYDLPARKRAYATIEELLARDTPYVYLWWPRQIEAINTDLKNFRPNGIVENWNSYEWSI